MAGTIPTGGIRQGMNGVVSMESGLDGRNNQLKEFGETLSNSLSQWSPA